MKYEYCQYFWDINIEDIEDVTDRVGYDWEIFQMFQVPNQKA